MELREQAMAEYQLYCFGESGNCYKAALMLQLSRMDWERIHVDYFGGETRSDAYRSKVNEMGEAPVLLHGPVKLTQSGVILDYLADKARKFGPKSEDERREIMRWILFDNHKFTSYAATLRFMLTFMKTGETPVTEFLRGRVNGAYGVLDRHLQSRDFVIGKRPTIADLSLCGYLFYGDELGVELEPYAYMRKWLERIKALPTWKHPYELMERAYRSE
jgi:glutathione S-transferase